MPRLPDFRPLPAHPAIVSALYLGRYLNRSRVMVKIKCPRCQRLRARTGTETRREMRRPNWQGYCRACAIASVKDGTHRWHNYRRARRSYKNQPNGYVLISPDEVADALLPIYRAMQRCGQPVLEHRFVMAKHLGRPLRSDECVDHMNGNTADNRIENLRLYVRGKQQPGSCPGHGTYYHEWQMTLRKVTELKKRLARLG